MRFFTEAFALLGLFTLYWFQRARREYLKQRIGRLAIRNVYSVARNIGFMLSRQDIGVQDNGNILEKGGIFYSFHFGIWELMPRALEKRGFDLGVLVNRYADDNHSRINRFFDNLLDRFRSSGNVKVFSKHDSMKIVRFLKNGGILGVLVDGNRFYAKYIKMKKLSNLCGVPLVPFAAYRKNGSGVLDLGCDLDRIVTQRPLDYVWFYKSRTD